MAPRGNNNNKTAMAVGVAVTALAGVLAAGFMLFDEQRQQHQHGPLIMEEVDFKEKEIEERYQPNDNSEKVFVLMQMGFPRDQILGVLEMFDNNLDQAIEWFLSKQQANEIGTTTLVENMESQEEREVFESHANENKAQELLDLNDAINDLKITESMFGNSNSDILIGQPLEEVSGTFSNSVYLNPNTPQDTKTFESELLGLTEDVNHDFSSAKGDSNEHVNISTKEEVLVNENESTETWIQKERREIQARLAYLAQLEMAETLLKSEPKAVEPEIQQIGNVMQPNESRASIPDLDNEFGSAHDGFGSAQDLESIAPEIIAGEDWDVISEANSQ